MGFLEFEISNPKVRGNRLGILELITRVEARALEYVKCTGESVLMDIRCSIQPEKELDIETGGIEDDDFGLAKSGLRLKRLLIVQTELPQKIPKIHILKRRFFLKR